VSPKRERSAPRWPVLIALVLVLAAGLASQRQRDQQSEPTPAVAASELLPSAAGPGALSSTWYCAAGTATGTKTGLAEQTVVIENASNRALSGQVTAVTDGGRSVARAVRVPARDHLDVRISDLVIAPYAAAVVEMGGGEVAVSHLLQGPTGTAVAACSSSPSSQWYLPAGNTIPPTRYLLALFNPFPSDAIATVTFQTEDGARTPTAYDGVVIPGGEVTVLEVDSVVTLRKEVSATIDVREGRLIVDQVLSADGTGGVTKGLSVTPAAPRGAPAWYFADGVASDSLKTTFVIANPGSQPAQVALHVRLDNAAQNGQVSPFTATVAPGGYAIIDIEADRRIPVGVGFTALATSAGQRPIVVEQLSVTDPTASPSGFQLAMGSPVSARQWLVPVGTTASMDSSVLAVTNPSATHAVRLRLSIVSGGSLAPLTGTTTEVTIVAGGRGKFFPPAAALKADSSFLVQADSPVVVQQLLGFTKAGLAGPLAVPVASSATTTVPRF
jgi:hypothetical protein